ncbi:MAG TPA: VOC family protein [Acidimicrobiales bacterium]|jgi:catechol 2,3-dioxygenase-like lactoylglutathione lyase family enzyme|nr:VOC family protein [Acidimicrobiales bacterium]
MLDDATLVAFIPVRDTALARPFYEATLGLRVVADTPFALVIDANGTEIRITPVPDLRPQPFTVAGWQVDDIAATVAELVQRGVMFNRYDGMTQDDAGIWHTPGGDRVAWFPDPDGNTLSLTQPAPG